jgi:hypothetical protein
MCAFEDNLRHGIMSCIGQGHNIDIEEEKTLGGLKKIGCTSGEIREQTWA